MEAALCSDSQSQQKKICITKLKCLVVYDSLTYCSLLFTALEY